MFSLHQPCSTSSNQQPRHSLLTFYGWLCLEVAWRQKVEQLHSSACLYSLQDVVQLLLCLLSSYLFYDWALCFVSFLGTEKDKSVPYYTCEGTTALDFNMLYYFIFPMSSYYSSVLHNFQLFFKSLCLFEFDFQFSKLYLFSNIYLLLHCRSVTLSY